MTKLKTLDDAPDGQKETKADKALREKLRMDVRNIETGHWQLGEGLYQVRQNALFRLWGYTTFQEYVVRDLEMCDRTAHYLAKLAEFLVKLKPEHQAWVKELGWTKAKEITEFVTNANAAAWRERVKGKTFKEIQAIIRENRVGALKEGESEKKADDATVEKPIQVRFPLYPEQERTVAQAIAHAQEIAQSDKKGHCLEMICLDYLASQAGVTNLEAYLKSVESYTGIRLIAVCLDEQSEHYGDVVFGHALWDKLGELVTHRESDEGESDEGEDEVSSGDAHEIAVEASA